MENQRLKGWFTPNQKTYFSIFLLVLFIHLDFGFSCQGLERFLSSLKYNGTRWHLALGAQSTIKKTKKTKTKQTLVTNCE